MKTGLTGSPRRTPALRSTPDSQDDLESSSPSDGKGLSAQSESRQDPSPLSTRSVNAGHLNQKNGARQKPTKAQLVGEPEPTFLPDFSDDEGDENTFAQVQQDFGDSLIANDEPLPTAELSDSPGPDQYGEDDDSPPVEAAPRTEPAASSKSTKKGPPAKPANADKSQAKPPGRRGRPRKSDHRDVEEDVDPRPAKKQKNAAKAPPREREPLEPELDRVVNNYANRTGPLKGRSLYILKRENPTDNSATHTRSGRVSVRPLAYWRNERCVFGDGEAAEGHRYPLSTIKEVIRTEEQEPHHKKKGKRPASNKSKSKSKKRKDESSDEEDEDVDLWEKEGGVLHGYTLKWDSKTQASSKEEEVLGKGTSFLISRSFAKSVCRYCICSFRHRDQGGQRLNFQIREVAQLFVHRVWSRGITP
jgi:centromere protein C